MTSKSILDHASFRNQFNKILFTEILLIIQFSYLFSTNLQAIPPVLSKSKTSLQTPQLQQPNSINCDNDLSGISRAKMRSVQQMVNQIQN